MFLNSGTPCECLAKSRARLSRIWLARPICLTLRQNTYFCLAGIISSRATLMYMFDAACVCCAPYTLTSTLPTILACFSRLTLFCGMCAGASQAWTCFLPGYSPRVCDPVSSCFARSHALTTPSHAPLILFARFVPLTTFSRHVCRCLGVDVFRLGVHSCALPCYRGLSGPHCSVPVV